MKTQWIWGLIAPLFVLFCAGYSVSGSPETLSGVIKDTDNIPVANAEISIFDGFTIRNVKGDRHGAYHILQLPVSADLHAVLFITKYGYIPSIMNIKRGAQDKADYPVTMKRGGTKKNGYVAGVVYQPIRGGKIKYQSGIHRFGPGKRVWLEKNGIITDMRTNQDGQFTFEVPGGRYVLHAEGSREKPVVEVTAGKTVIRNMRSGIVLID